MSDLPGVQILLVHQSVRLWRVYHELFECCVVPVHANTNRPASFWRYRRWNEIAGPGLVMLMEPGEVHDSWKVTAPATFFVVQFAPELVWRMAGELDLPGATHLRLCQAEDHTLEAEMTALCRSCCGEATTLARQTLLARAVRMLLARYGEDNLAEVRSDAPPSRLRLARDFIVQHCADRLTLDDLVALTGLSRFHLIRSFSRHFGITPHRLQLLARLSHAQRLLRAGIPPAEAAVGFADQSHFTRHFRRAMGVSPAEYQRQTLARNQLTSSIGRTAILF